MKKSPTTPTQPHAAQIEGWSALTHNMTLFGVGIGMFVSTAILVPKRV